MIQGAPQARQQDCPRSHGFGYQPPDLYELMDKLGSKSGSDPRGFLKMFANVKTPAQFRGFFVSRRLFANDFLSP